MIKKLQRKFIMITMSSLLLVMLLIVGSINGVYLYQMETRTNGTIELLAENQGKFPMFDKGNIPKYDEKSGFQINAETQFETRYFTVVVQENGDLQQIDTSHIAAISSKDAANFAAIIISSGKNSGYEGIYKFAVVDQAEGYLIIFLDCRSSMQTAEAMILISCIVALITLILVFILVSAFSKKAIGPIIDSMEKQKQFITDAGHEIKTPLAIISANADVLEITGGESEWITSIRNQIIRLDKLVKNLLTLSKMGENDIKMMFSNFNLSEAIAETVAPFETIAETQNKKFQMNIQPDLKMNGDKSSIEQLVSTLVDNALKYSSEEGTIKITLSSSKKGIKLTVYNTTDEIDTENLNRLFDRFYRADESRSRDTGGYGIGLSIAKSIVEAHHGKISAQSEDGKSISFTATFLN